MGGGIRGVARVSFGAKGAIMFNKEAVGLMELKAGDKLSFCQDEDEPDNWYFFKDKEHGFELRGNKANGCCFNHLLLIQAFLEAKEQPAGQTLKALIAGQPTVMKNDKAATRYWGVLVRASA